MNKDVGVLNDFKTLGFDKLYSMTLKKGGNIPNSVIFETVVETRNLAANWR